MTETLTVPAPVVPYLRSGLVSEHGSALDLVMIQHERERIDEAAWNEAHQSMDAARGLLEGIGVAAPEVEVDVKVDLTEAPLLVLDALIAIQGVEVMRVQDAATDGVRPNCQGIAALASFLEAVERAVDPSGELRREGAHRVVDRTPRPVRGQIDQ